MAECEVCELQKKNDPRLILFENDDWVVVLRTDDQQYVGKSVVSCKHHIAHVADISDEVWQNFAECTRWYERQLDAVFEPANYNWQCLMNLGAAAGATHVHWHATPRYDTLVEFAGETFRDWRWPKSARPMEDHRLLDVSIVYQIADAIRSGSRL